MLISYRDSRRYPSEPLALTAWVRIAELTARQIVCPRPFDPLQFARALELCRRLTCKEGPSAIKRMIVACAAAGVAVVVVPGFDRCHASSASKWLVEGRRAMIALSIRYRRDDQIYFSLFREAGAILLAQKLETRSTKHETNAGNASDFGFRISDLSGHDPDRFAREFLIPPQYDQELTLLIARKDREAAILTLAKRLGIAPGLVVGRMQHDGMIGWKDHNWLKRQVDCSWALCGAEALEETWPDQQAATRAVMRDLSLGEAQARERVRRAAAGGTLLTNGQTRRQMRFDPGLLATWRLMQRDRDLDAEDRQEAA